MKQVITALAYVCLLLSTSLIACKKEEVLKPGPAPGQPANPQETLKIKLQAVISVGEILYDSLPATFKIRSWDAAGRLHEKDTLLEAGAREIFLPKSHLRFQFSLNKWGLADEMTLLKSEVKEGEIYTLGGKKAAKKLQVEDTYIFASGSYRPSSRTVYTYGENGKLKEEEFFGKVPQHNELRYTSRNVYQYNGGSLKKINRFDEKGTATGFTAFTYNAQGTKVINMHQKSYDQETWASVEHTYPAGHALITFDYLYSNGQAMEYKIKIRGGNKVEDEARSSTNAGEGGTYRYDFNINPYAHLNMPNLYLSNLSKNNLLQQEKSYAGGFPTAEPYRFEYIYDEEGYPKELVRSYKNYLTGEHLYKTKTVYTY